MFAGVSSERLTPLADAVRRFDSGEKIIAAGEAPRFVVVIMSGEARICVGGVHLVTRKRHDVIGEQAFIDGVNHSADCIAATPVTALCIDAEAFDGLHVDHAFVRNLESALSRKLRESTQERSYRYRSEELLAAEFRSHVARPVRDELLAKGLEYGRPRRVEAAVLFSDIRDFTATSEKMDPLLIAADLSGYFSDAVDHLHAHGAFVDKFIGDAVMAFWGFPGLAEVDAERMLVCAEGLVEVARRHELGGSAIRVGVGLSFGSVFMGNIGSAEKRQFTIIGPAVNLAARLEGACRDHGWDVLASESFALRLSPERRSTLTCSSGLQLRGAEQRTAFGLRVGGND
ncbi:MAG TPA: adenylate/guanylate cyclase domain-containing protein [Candidatus Eremiobacteraceae bacterium]|nr:adenylate/guanylate cyclase domain-containing protein [Candidatus Eremiobacteraceae bacterium]